MLQGSVLHWQREAADLFNSDIYDVLEYLHSFVSNKRM